jgi:putative intracellular protease/amidase
MPQKEVAVKTAITAVLLIGLASVVPTGVLPNDAHLSSAGSGQVRAMLLVNNAYGGNYNLLRDVLDSYGWQTTVVGVTPTVTACYYGGPMTVDTLVTDLTDASPYDCLLIMPANHTDSHRQLLNSPEALALVSQAVGDTLLVAAFCGGTRVLAAAQVISGVTVTGNPDFVQEYLDAGAIWAGDGVPPVLDGNILTSRRNQYYSQQVCEVIRAAVDSLRALRGRN